MSRYRSCREGSNAVYFTRIKPIFVEVHWYVLGTIKGAFCAPLRSTIGKLYSIPL